MVPISCCSSPVTCQAGVWLPRSFSRSSISRRVGLKVAARMRKSPGGKVSVSVGLGRDFSSQALPKAPAGSQHPASGGEPQQASGLETPPATQAAWNPSSHWLNVPNILLGSWELSGPVRRGEGITGVWGSLRRKPVRYQSVCLGLSATGEQTSRWFVSFSRKKKKILSQKESVLQSVSGRSRLSASAFSSYRWAVSPKRAAKGSVGFNTRLSESFSANLPRVGIWVPSTHVICRKRLYL